MASPRASGRMIRKDVSRSHKIASLSERAGFLFFMLIPHLNSYGKLNGSPHFIKGEVVPLISWFTVPIIEKCLQEISDKTNVKWFERDGLQYLHSVNWEDHQKLEEKKRGNDDLPSWEKIVDDKSTTTHRLGSPEVEVEVEVEGEVEVQGEGESRRAKRRPAFTPPTVEQVAKYCQERGNNIDAKYWVDSYEAKGWMIGKTKMSSWKAAIRTWEGNGMSAGRKEKPEPKGASAVRAWAEKNGVTA